MIFTTTVVLKGQDHFAYTPDQAAAQVLAALGGNPTKDSSLVTVEMQTETGMAGVDPNPPPPAPPA